MAATREEAKSDSIIIEQAYKIIPESSPPTMPGRTRPIDKFAKATSKCSLEVANYGKCIVADYNAVQKDMCAKEFMKLKDCYLAAAKKG